MPKPFSSGQPDGTWLEKPENILAILRFLVSKLSANDLEELDDQLTGAPEPTATDRRLATDGLRRDFLRYGPIDRKAIRNALKPKALAQDEIDARMSFDERFPNAKRFSNGGRG